MASDTNILIIDDDADVLHSAQLLLRQHYARVDAEQDPTVINRVVSQQAYEVVLLDMNFRRGEHDGREGLYWLERILTINPRIRVILITTYGDVELAVEAMRQGAAHFLLKPWKNQQLLEVINTALARQPRSTALSTASEAFTASPMIGESPLMQSVYELVDKVAPTEANVLILGENGTGKELIAQELHHQSARRSGPFVRVDLGAVAPSLVESELFGHVKGAFTDAHHDRSGPFEEARGGTLFLDEIGNLPLAQQAKLLSVLQSRTVRRVGGNQDIPLDVRLLCATNRALPGEEGFREDLLYRINTVEIRLPPLRERAGDIAKLADHFLQHYAQKYRKPIPEFSQEAQQQLERHSWPGNVRELQHAIERAVILNEAPTLSANAFVLDASLAAQPATDPAQTLDENERNFIRQALQRHQGNITQTAQALGITRTALYRRLDKYGL
ncbi:MAG: sigma-54 dependent transcriptional regulator [Tunicatimonas sp.]